MSLLMGALKAAQWLLTAVGILSLGPLLILLWGPASLSGDWRTASSRPTQQAPDPAVEHGPVVQVYAARTFGWRGAFAVHTWVAAKPANAARYNRYEVIGWNLYRGDSAVSNSSWYGPDAEWFGQKPVLIADRRGEEAAAIIAALPAAVASYPYAAVYRAWPGPNSNTFIAHLGRRIPALRLSLPGIAIGKAYLPGGAVLGRAPSGTGFQLSIAGVIGLLAAADEGIEVNLLGLVVGVDVRHPALKLPGIGCVPECFGS